MRERRPLGQALVATAILLLATVAVGLTAGADGPFSIVVRPIFLRLGVDVDIKFGSIHLHANWSALPDSSPQAPSLKSATDQP